MRKLLLTLAICFVALTSWASRAIRTPLTIKQSDGTYITVRLVGDEHFHYYVDMEGNILERTGNDFKKISISKEEYLAQGEAKRNKALKKISVGTYNPNYFPHKGSPKALIILVNFTDTTFSLTDPKKSFTDFLNAEGKLTNYGNREDRNMGSVRSYFKTMSNGAFTPEFDVVGPVTVSKDLAYYGENSSSSNDVNHREMIKEAIELVDKDVDFSQYDYDGDGNVDMVGIIYAGYGENLGSPSETLWPKSGFSSLGSKDGKNIRRYIINAELNYYPTYVLKSEPNKRISGIGVFCHEFSHAMGLPDFYPYNEDTRLYDNQAMEYWDLMDGGEYLDNTYCPMPYTAFEKEAMGWYTVDSIYKAGQYSLTAGEAVRINGEDNEYIILENIPVDNSSWYYGINSINKFKTGNRDLGGLLVYRVDYPYSTVQMSHHVNDVAGQPGMTVVPADGILYSYYNESAKELYELSMCTDLYPYNDVINNEDKTTETIALDSIVSVKLNRSTLNKPIYNITFKDNVVTFDFLKKTVSGIDGILYNKEADDNKIFSVDGRFVGTDKSLLPKGIYISNGKKFIVK